jgi:hypothetical protein
MNGHFLKIALGMVVGFQAATIKGIEKRYCGTFIDGRRQLS